VDNVYCVIQRLTNKTPNKYGHPKSLEVSTMTISSNDEEPQTIYNYSYSSERFERLNRDTYKISIHKSFREQGRVKKKQWVICTMDYYDLVDGTWAGDYVNSNTLEKKLQEMQMDESTLWDLVYDKLQPLIDKALVEYHATEEYKTSERHSKIVRTYEKAKKEFEAKYGKNTYNRCYDVFGVLRNETFLEGLKKQYEANQRYKGSSSYYSNSYGNYTGDSGSSYSNSGYSNYSYEDFSSYFGTKGSNYTEEDKVKLKKIYKALALHFHPDRSGDDGEMMKLVNRLKEDWGI
jgi:hypothetical protein